MREEFWRLACSVESLWHLLMTLNLVFLLILSVTLVALPSGSPSYYISAFSLIMVVPLVVVSGYAFRRCARRRS